MKYELHPACAAWPQMSETELQELADDIKANGLHEPVTFTPKGELLEGRNRVLACERAGVELKTVIHNGDAWLFSISKNARRRHMATDQLAMVVAQLVTTAQGGDRRSESFKTSNEGLKVADAAKAAAVSKTDIESAKVVLKHGTEEEKADVLAGKAKLRKTADAARSRRRQLVTPRSKKTPVQSRDPYEDPYATTLREVIAKCADDQWHSLEKMASTVGRAESAVKEGFRRLTDAVQTRGADNGEYRISEYLRALVGGPKRGE
jgi:ParB-like chromosome segregation protein Spo0J